MNFRHLTLDTLAETFQVTIHYLAEFVVRHGATPPISANDRLEMLINEEDSNTLIASINTASNAEINLKYDTETIADLVESPGNIHEYFSNFTVQEVLDVCDRENIPLPFGKDTVLSEFHIAKIQNFIDFVDEKPFVMTDEAWNATKIFKKSSSDSTPSRGKVVIDADRLSDLEEAEEGGIRKTLQRIEKEEIDDLDEDSDDEDKKKRNVDDIDPAFRETPYSSLGQRFSAEDFTGTTTDHTHPAILYGEDYEVARNIKNRRVISRRATAMSEEDSPEPIIPSEPEPANADDSADADFD